MIKILNNTTASPIEIADVGISISANSSYTIPSQDYNLFASSDDIVSYIGTGEIVVNDGNINLSAAQGIGLIQGSFVKKTVNFDSSLIDGQNRLKVILDQVSPNDYLVKVSSDDTTGAYLQDKILQTNNKLSVTVENDGANEKIRLNIGSDVFDKSTNTTDNITEGATNKYYTSERAQDDVSNAIQSGSQDGISFSYNDTANTYSFTNTDKGSTAVNDHIMDLDPHSQYLKEDDDILSTQNVLKVKKNPGNGEYLTIESAISAISGSSSVNPFVIKVGPGVFEENTLVLPAYVSVEGETIQGTIVKTATNTQDLFVMNTGCELSFMSLYGLLGSGYAAVKCQDVGDFAQLHKLSIYDFDIAIKNKTVSGESTLYVEYVDINGDYTYGVSSEATNNFYCKTQLENFYSYESTDVNSIVIIASGQNCELKVGTSGLDSANEGIRISNGVSLSISDVFIKNMSVGLSNPNTGNAVTIKAHATQIENCTEDIKILHPSSTGSIQAIANHDNSTIDSDSISLFVLNPTNDDVVINGRLNYSQYGYSTISDISDALIKTPTMGLIYGGEISIATGLNVEITTGYGHLNVGTEPTDSIQRIEWVTTTLAIPAYSLVNIYVNDAGTIVTHATYPDTSRVIYLGRAISNGSSVLGIEKVPVKARYFNNLLTKTLREAFGPVFSTGCLTAEYGTRQLTVTSGRYFFAEVELNPTGGSPITFTSAYKSAIPGLYTTSSGQTTVSNTQYDDGSGTLASIPTGKFVKHLLVVVGGPSEQYVVVYGDAVYDTLAEAQNAPIVDASAFSKGSFARIASIIVQQGQSNIQDIIDERPRIGFASSSSVGGVTSHSALSDLSNDDHTQYLLTSGARSMSGSLNMGTNNITNVGTVDGVDISSHASRHLPNGSDPLTTGTPSSISTSNSEGIANAFARQDHVHNHGSQTSQDHHAVATTSAHGFMSSTDKTKLDGIEAGATNYTDEKAQDAVGTILTNTSTVTFSYNDVANTISANVAASGISHNSLSGLTVDDPHTQYAFLSGRSSGQTLNGGTNSTASLTLSSTTNTNKGKIYLGSGSAYDESNNWLGINTTSPRSPIHVAGTSTSTIRGISHFQYSTDTVSSKACFGKARGIPSSPTSVITNDVLANYTFFGYGTTDFIQGAAIRGLAQQTFTDSAAGTNIEIQTAAVGGTTMQTVLTLQSDTQTVASNAIRPGDSTIATNGNIRNNVLNDELHGYYNSEWRVLGLNPVTLTATSTVSTTSATYATINTMTTTPTAGTYFVIFSCNADLASDTSADIGIFKAGTLEAITARTLAINASGSAVADYEISFSTFGIITVNGSQVVDVRYRENGSGTLTITERELYLIPISRS